MREDIPEMLDRFLRRRCREDAYVAERKHRRFVFNPIVAQIRDALQEGRQSVTLSAIAMPPEHSLAMIASCIYQVTEQCLLYPLDNYLVHLIGCSYDFDEHLTTQHTTRINVMEP